MFLRYAGAQSCRAEGNWSVSIAFGGAVGGGAEIGRGGGGVIRLAITEGIIDGFLGTFLCRDFVKDGTLFLS